MGLTMYRPSARIQRSARDQPEDKMTEQERQEQEQRERDWQIVNERLRRSERHNRNGWECSPCGEPEDRLPRW